MSAGWSDEETHQHRLALLLQEFHGKKKSSSQVKKLGN